VTLSAYRFRETHAALGIEVPRLGCIMLDVDVPPDLAAALAAAVPQEDVYVSSDPSRAWIRGVVALDGPHVTLLYGLLGNGNAWREHVDAVLDDWERPTAVPIESWGMFPSTFEDEPYACIVAHVERTPALLEAHARLSMLPHIDTHPEYRPHVTIAYVRRDAVDAVLERLAAIPHPVLAPLGLDYGDPAR
jgi:2'-5' RNA ligase